MYLVLGMMSFIRASAQEIPVYQAWDQRITNFYFEALLPDNLGHLVTAGYRDGAASTILIDTNGQPIASAATCGQGDPNFGVVAADSEGRIFLATILTNKVRCVRFEPLLSAGSRLPERMGTGGSFDPVNALHAVADGMGGVNISATLASYGTGRAMVLGFDCTTNFAVPMPYGSYYQDLRTASLIRANDDLYHVAVHVGYGGSAYILVSRRRSADGQLVFHHSYTGNEFPKAATADSAGNIIIVGARRDGDAPWYPLTLKLAPAGTVLWRHVENDRSATMLAVAVDRSDNIIATGTGGTFKYSSEGLKLWRNDAFGTVVKIDTTNNVIMSRGTFWTPFPMMVTKPTPIDTTKLRSDGTLVWQARFEALSAYSDYGPYVTGLVVENAAVYLGARYGFEQPGYRLGLVGSVVKYVEIPAFPIDPSPRTPIEAPATETCEPFKPGPCDTPPLPPPPPPPPPAEVSVTRLGGSKVVVCWPTNYVDYILQGTRRINRRHPDRTRWVDVLASPVCDMTRCCVTNRIAQFGTRYRIVKP